MDNANLDRNLIVALLEWQLDCGVDEAIEPHAVDMATPPSKVATSMGIAGSTPNMETPTAKTQAPLHPLPAAASSNISAKQAGSLAELRQLMQNDEQCLLKKTASRLVFGDGNPESAIMVVGEAPGADEDRQGIPFVGAAGQLLDKMLLSIGLNRQNCYITNVLVWRPPGNRKPTPLEIMQMIPYLEQHIELVKPQMLLALGDSAAKALTGVQEGITRVRGKWLNAGEPKESMGDHFSCRFVQPIPCLLTYHPAFLLRSPLNKKQAWQDLLLVKNFMKERGIS
ncbi:MAG: uracil-DNA glycosylase [Alphaproteobacteria bacterium]